MLATAIRIEYLALIATPQTELRSVVPTVLTRLLPRSGRTVPAGRIRVWDQNSAESLTSVKRSVGEAIAWMTRHGLHPSEIVVDASKGRRSMQFGALIAADHLMVELQYLAADWHQRDNRPRAGSEEFSVVREYWRTAGPRRPAAERLTPTCAAGGSMSCNETAAHGCELLTAAMRESRIHMVKGEWLSRVPVRPG
jgi:hypothetical protein